MEVGVVCVFVLLLCAHCVNLLTGKHFHSKFRENYNSIGERVGIFTTHQRITDKTKIEEEKNQNKGMEIPHGSSMGMNTITRN